VNVVIFVWFGHALLAEDYVLDTLLIQVAVLCSGCMFNAVLYGDATVCWGQEPAEPAGGEDSPAFEATLLASCHSRKLNSLDSVYEWVGCGFLPSFGRPCTLCCWFLYRSPHRSCEALTNEFLQICPPPSYFLHCSVVIWVFVYPFVAYAWHERQRLCSHAWVSVALPFSRSLVVLPDLPSVVLVLFPR
jgi:hypothetical protein